MNILFHTAARRIAMLWTVALFVSTVAHTNTAWSQATFNLTVVAPAADTASAESSKSGIYVMNADGTGQKLLASVKDSAWQGWPRWSNDGTYIAFEVQAKDAKAADAKTYTVLAAGGEPKDLGLGRAPSWSPDDKQLLVSVPRANSFDTKNGCWIMNADGSARQWFTTGRNACYSPDGGHIAFVNGHEGSDNIYIYDVLEGKSKFMLQEKYLHIYGCSWSADGTQICFCGNRQGSPPELAIMDAASTDKPVKVRLSDKNLGHNPSWSPGSKILVSLLVGESPRLHIVDPQTEDAPVLLNNPSDHGLSIDASWSPDGKQIAFSSNPPAGS